MRHCAARTDAKLPSTAADAAALNAAAEAKANDLLKQIHKGATFDDVAKKNSDGPTAAHGGDLGMFKRGNSVKGTGRRTFAMKAGDITDVIRTKQGFVILKVIEHQQAGIPTHEEMASAKSRTRFTIRNCNPRCAPI